MRALLGGSTPIPPTTRIGASHACQQENFERASFPGVARCSRRTGGVVTFPFDNRLAFSHLHIHRTCHNFIQQLCSSIHMPNNHCSVSSMPRAAPPKHCCCVSPRANGCLNQRSTVTGDSPKNIIWLFCSSGITGPQIKRQSARVLDGLTRGATEDQHGMRQQRQVRMMGRSACLRHGGGVARSR